MIDREKVIKAVECRRNAYKRCGNPCEQIGDCEYAVWARDSDSEPYYPCCCDKEKLCDDILVLLKEQEAVEPILKREGRNKYYNYYVCPFCDEEVVYDQNYCSECGAKFMWEGR